MSLVNDMPSILLLLLLQKLEGFAEVSSQKNLYLPYRTLHNKAC